VTGSGSLNIEAIASPETSSSSGSSSVALQHGIKPLNRGDGDAADGVYLSRLEVLDVVEFREFAPVIWSNELLELFECLVSKVSSVYKEKDTPGTGMFDQAIHKVDRREGLTTAGGHLDQGTRSILGKRLFEVLDSFNLSVPELAGDQWRHFTQSLVKLFGLSNPFYESLWPVKRENATAGIVRVKSVTEAGLRASAFVAKWQRIAPAWIIEKTGGVLERLSFHAGKGVPLRFGLYGGDRFPTSK
jgi:hypothetical protein